MRVAVLECPFCEDEWHVPNPRNLREECKECGSPLEKSMREVGA